MHLPTYLHRLNRQKNQKKKIVIKPLLATIKPWDLCLELGVLSDKVWIHWIPCHRRVSAVADMMCVLPAA